MTRLQKLGGNLVNSKQNEDLIQKWIAIKKQQVIQRSSQP